MRRISAAEKTKGSLEGAVRTTTNHPPTCVVIPRRRRRSDRTVRQRGSLLACLRRDTEAEGCS